MRTAYIFVGLLFLTVTSFGQLPKKTMKKMGQNPVLFLDSTETDMAALQKLNPFDISNISIVKPKKAKRLLGDKGSDGAIYVTTVKEAKKIYWAFFSTKSDHYKKLLDSPQADSIVQYVLNGQTLSDSAAPGSLFLVTDKNFKSLAIMDKEKILSDDIEPKRYVVAITSKRLKGIVKKSQPK
ncbi:MAG TPA: hypothetical protein VIZ28_05405 [Chitinophagaceae bacterium]